MFKLNELEVKMADFLENNDCFIENPISMRELSTVFNISERDVREAIENIILSGRLVIGNINGYWLARNKREIKIANSMNKARTKKSIERMIANRGDINWLFPFLKELNDKYQFVSDNQISIEELMQNEN